MARGHFYAAVGVRMAGLIGSNTELAIISVMDVQSCVTKLNSTAKR